MLNHPITLYEVVAGSCRVSLCTRDLVDHDIQTIRKKPKSRGIEEQSCKISCELSLAFGKAPIHMLKLKSGFEEYMKTAQLILNDPLILLSYIVERQSLCNPDS
jgi:hypothetical protein